MLHPKVISQAFDPNVLRLIVFPTEQCNFRCIYCYEDFAVGRMRPPVINGLKEFLTRRVPSLSTLRLSWFGGEPTTAPDIIENIMSHAISIAGDDGAEIHGDMTTNAYRLNAGMLAMLCDLRITEFQVTLDGPEKFHNKTRSLANGRGTFSRIFDNLRGAKATSLPFAMTLRIHLTPENAELMPDFVDELRETLLDDPRFMLFFKAVGHWGGPNDREFHVLGKSKEASLIESLKLRTRGEVSQSNPQYEEDVCYAARPNNFIVRADGRIEKCTVALNKPANLVGRLNANGTLSIDNRTHQYWLEGWKDLNTQTLSCPFFVASNLYQGSA